MGGRSIYLPRGKTLGGCSATNAMMYIRGHSLDYDAWEKQGCSGWGYNSVLPYFKRSEDNERGGSQTHGGYGPLCVTNIKPSPIAAAFVAACEGQEIARNDDFNGSELEGVGLTQVTIRNGARHSAASAYLDPIKAERKNLTIETGAQVERVLFEGRRAMGVAYRRDGKKAIAHAAREVILCAGAYNSPQLLMLSGIGPAAHLKKFNVPVVCNLPGVGQNLLEHVVVGVFVACSKPITLFGAKSKLQQLRYLLTKKGLLASNGAEAAAFVRTRSDCAAPDLELLFCNVLYLDEGLTPPEEHGFTLAPILLQPRSVGQVTLSSANPADPPRIDPNFLSDPENHDIQVLIKGIELARRVLAQDAMKPFVLQELRPGKDTRDADEVARYVRRRAHHMYHPVGTCKMGVGEDAVVDTQLRVRGVDGLRVMDASVMPTITRGHTLAPTIMIAEKGSDIVRGLKDESTYD
jgi:choline dehydrogenase